MKTTAFDRWLKRVKDVITPWTEHEIIYFRKAIGVSGLVDPAERAFLRSEFEACAASIGYRITAEQDSKGRGYLLSMSLRRDGRTKRKGCILGDHELCVLKELDRHYLVGLASNGPCFLPVYRAVAVGGESFDYIGATYEMVRVVAVGGSFPPRIRVVGE